MAASSSAAQLRRRPAPVNTSTRRARSDTCISSEIDIGRSSKPAPNIIPFTPGAGRCSPDDAYDSCPVRAEQVLEGHGRPLRTTLSRASDCAKYEIMLDVALHFDPGGHSCAEKLNKTNDRVGRETRQLFKLG